MLRERGLCENKYRNTWQNLQLCGVEISKSAPISQYAFLSMKRAIEEGIQQTEDLISIPGSISKVNFHLEDLNRIFTAATLDMKTI